jgi:hypothetical protein
LVWHVSTPLPLHMFWPWAHTPVHPPLTHVWLVHAVAFCQVPVALQVCGCEGFAHWTWVGAQTPWQEPPTHVWFEQGEPALCHAPPVLQVWGC